MTSFVGEHCGWPLAPDQENLPGWLPTSCVCGDLHMRDGSQRPGRRRHFSPGVMPR